MPYTFNVREEIKKCNPYDKKYEQTQHDVFINGYMYAYQESERDHSNFETDVTAHSPWRSGYMCYISQHKLIKLLKGDTDD